MPFSAPDSGQFKPGTRLRHYKGGIYTVVGTCLIEATLETGVLYKPLQGDKQDIVWMRPMAQFQEVVQMDDAKVPRFILVSETSESGS